MKRPELAAVAGACLALAAGAASAQSGPPWPTKTIRMICPFAPGGATDIFARITAQRLQASLKQNVVIKGLTEDEALKTITYNGALQLGVQDHVGSIEVGKDADVVIWSGDPLSVYSSAETTFIDGEIFFDKQRDLAMRDQMAKERAALEAAERGRRTTPVIP